MGVGELVCTRCRLGDAKDPGLAPTELHRWRIAAGLSLVELAEATRVSVPTLARALRGEPVGERTARKLERVTRIPCLHFLEGEPSPFGGREQ